MVRGRRKLNKNRLRRRLLSAARVREGCLRAWPVLLTGLLVACAADLPRTPTNLGPTGGPAKVLRINAPVPLTHSIAYPRTLEAGSVWRQIGTIPEGDVYKIENSVFTVEARNVHEAFIVVKDQAVVGFYLPVEKAFSSLSAKAVLPAQ